MPRTPHLYGLPLPTLSFQTITCVVALSLMPPSVHAQVLDEMLDMQLQELLDIEVTSVSRHEQNLLTAPAAIHVITSEDLRRRGITSIPEALRMVPGIHVAAIDGNKWVVSSRGFSGRYANKLLVQIDGRSVYTPSYSGVYWDMQDLLISDIDRIEVIRGPGAALWGANAVNGVINIISKPALETQGTLVEVGAGNQLQTLASARYGTSLSNTTDGRFYLKGRDYASNDLRMGAGDANDDWQTISGGFRLDGQPDDNNSWTLQGDVFHAHESQIISTLWQAPPNLMPITVEDNYEVDGWNLLGRWKHTHADQSESALQMYWDRAERDEVYLGQQHDTWDIDFQHQLPPIGRHSLIWGAGYRYIDTEFRNTFAVSSIRRKQSVELFSLFIQDKISLSDQDDLNLTIGSKFEHNDFTGFEIQPSARLMWIPATGHGIWGGISRAVRTPSFLEDNSQITITNIPITVRLEGTPEFAAEELSAYELGYRYHGNSHFTLDASLFYNDYDNYLSFEPISPTRIITSNQLSGHAYGAELSLIWQASPDWQLKANYSHIQVDMTADSTSLDQSSAANIEGASPENMLSLHSVMDLDENWELDTWLYYNDDVPRPSSVATNNALSIDDYISVNARIAWQAQPGLELSLTANNIFDNRHLEYVGEYFSSPTEIRRSVLLQIRWQF